MSLIVDRKSREAVKRYVTLPPWPASIVIGPWMQGPVVHSAVIRAQPIALTALAAMLGAFFILDDPIFNGLAVSLIFGILVSTLLTLVVIPVLYYAVNRRARA